MADFFGPSQCVWVCVSSGRVSVFCCCLCHLVCVGCCLSTRGRCCMLVLTFCLCPFDCGCLPASPLPCCSHSPRRPRPPAPSPHSPPNHGAHHHHRCGMRHDARCNTHARGCHGACTVEQQRSSSSARGTVVDWPSVTPQPVLSLVVATPAPAWIHHTAHPVALCSTVRRWSLSLLLLRCPAASDRHSVV